MKTLTLHHYQKSPARSWMQNFLDKAGITINGSNPFDITVNDDRFYKRVLVHGTLGLGESYIEEWWDCPRLDELVCRLFRSEISIPPTNRDRLLNLANLFKKIVNFQSLHLSAKNVAFHYDLGNDLFESMLDKRLTYTCAYWKNAKSLDEAQEAKLELACRKLHLQPGMKVLDIGCGFGSFAQYAAERYHVNVTGLTLSKSQWELGSKRCSGLPVDIRLHDYREAEGSYDRVVSLGMFEHVGLQNFKTYFKKAHALLKPGGIFLLHTIGSNQTTTTSEPWLEKYIFPNYFIPSISQITAASQPYFILEDLHNFGADYDRTLMAWFENFNKNWVYLKKKYNNSFYRIWRYYLLTCAGSFRARKNQLWQIILTKNPLRGYESIR